MAREPIFQWEGTEYSFNDHGADWYWALGIIATAAALTALLFSNILLALVIAAAAVTVGLQAAKHKRTHTFTIGDTGLFIDDVFYSFEHMRDFAILEYLDPELPLALSIKTNHILSPHLLIPINDYDPEEVYEYIASHLPEGTHEETLIDRLASFLKF